ncbi:MAG: NAD(P)H-dependent oxidoreductase subunit E, partial [Anaerolineales bacterium]
MSEIDLTPLPKILNPYVSLGRSGLLPALHAAQKHYGWLSQPLAAEVARTLNVPLADVHGVIEFYALFYNEPVGKRVIRVCTDVACALKGADKVLDDLCTQHGIRPHQTTPDAAATIEHAPCLGLCEHAPAVWTEDGGQSTVGDGAMENSRPLSMVYGQDRLLTKNCGGETTTLETYGEYAALKKARKMNPAEVIAEIKAAGLVGRGGAAFPTAIKWEGAANADGDEKYVICNADESEPGTFKDRILLLDDPHSTIEGMCIAAHSIGATKGYIYLRGEYPYILPVLENALT